MLRGLVNTLDNFIQASLHRFPLSDCQFLWWIWHSLPQDIENTGLTFYKDALVMTKYVIKQTAFSLFLGGPITSIKLVING